MSFSKEYIKENSCRLYDKLTEVPYSFAELQHISGLDDSTLCLVLIQLIRENKMEQRYNDGNIYYQKSVNVYMKAQKKEK